MPIVKVEAPEGVQLRVRKQGRVEKAGVITSQGFDEHGNETLVKSFGPKVTTWPDTEIENFATETRSYTVDADNRIIVEAQ